MAGKKMSVELPLRIERLRRSLKLELLRKTPAVGFRKAEHAEEDD